LTTGTILGFVVMVVMFLWGRRKQRVRTIYAELKKFRVERNKLSRTSPRTEKTVGAKWVIWKMGKNRKQDPYTTYSANYTVCKLER